VENKPTGTTGVTPVPPVLTGTTGQRLVLPVVQFCTKLGLATMLILCLLVPPVLPVHLGKKRLCLPIPPVLPVHPRKKRLF